MTYISIGLDCSVAWQLQKHNIRTVAFPFDWMKISSIDTICRVIESDFRCFFDREHIRPVEITTSFPVFEDDFPDVFETETGLKVQNTYYNITFPHEFHDVADFETNFDKIKDKYERRIQRFNEYITKPDTKLVFVSNKKTSDIDKLKKIVKQKYDVDVDVVNICYDKKMKISSWHKNEIDWKTYLL